MLSHKEALIVHAVNLRCKSLSWKRLEVFQILKEKGAGLSATSEPIQLSSSLERFARNGGPSSEQFEMVERKRKAREAVEPDATESIERFSTSNVEFRQLLESVGVVYPIYGNHEPSDLKELQDYLGKEWPGIEEEISKESFQKFVRRNDDACSEATVDDSIRDILGADGFDAGEGSSNARNVRCVRMKSFRPELTNPQPDFQEGAEKRLAPAAVH